MNKLEIEKFDKKFKELSKFTQSQEEYYKESEIIDWISECVNVFYEVGVDSIIIRNFLDHFRSSAKMVENESTVTRRKFIVKTIDPFREQINPGILGEPTGMYVLSGSFYYARIAFSAAGNTLKNKVDRKRIVPFWLLESLSSNDNYSHIVSSLELIEQAYQNKDADGLVKNSSTLLDSVLDQDNELKSKQKLGRKMSALIDNEELQERFGINSDFARGLNNMRIVRNYKSVHKDLPIQYNIPLLVAISCAYLTTLFLEITLSSGAVFDEN